MSVLNISNSLKTRSDVEPVDPSLVPLFVSELITGQYFNLALATALIYHSIISMDQEIKYFWPKPRSAVSIIYFANRYIGILAALCEIPRQFAFWTGSLANKITIVLIDYILLIRVSALWNQDKNLSIILKITLGLGFGLSLGILIYGKLVEELVVGRLAEGVTVCAYDGDPPRILSIVSWLVPTTYGLILLCLALYKAAEYWKLSSGFKGFRLVRVLIQDQVVYYGLVIFCSACKIVDLVIIDISPAISDILNVAGSPTLLCILGGQLLINLKEAGERGANGGTNYTPKISDIDFGENGANNERISVQQGSV
ncbi:hypothetical protein ACEPAH_1950 [Sanghuangporus vaninii]